MLNQHEFNRCCETLGLEDFELDLAALVWQRCERVMQGQTTQQAVLLGQKQIPVRIKVQVDEAFSQQELQMLYDRFREENRWKQAIVAAKKDRAAVLWEKCDKADATTAEDFIQMNKHKSDIRALKAVLAKEASLIRILKKMLRSKQKVRPREVSDDHPL